MSTLAEAFAVLTGKKVYDGGVWHVYDEFDVEISNPGEILLNCGLGAAPYYSKDPAVISWLAALPPNLEIIYEVLTGEKRYYNGAWHVFDADGVELVNPGWTLVKGNMGALINQFPNALFEASSQGVAAGYYQRMRFAGRAVAQPTGSPIYAARQGVARALGGAKARRAPPEHFHWQVEGVGKAGGSATAERTRLRTGGAKPHVRCAAQTCPVAHGVETGSGVAFSSGGVVARTPISLVFAQSPTEGRGRGVDNPTDEQIAAIALMALRKRRLTARNLRV